MKDKTSCPVCGSTDLMPFNETRDAEETTRLRMVAYLCELGHLMFLPSQIDEFVLPVH